MKILLATDADPASAGAIRAADELSREGVALVEVIRVVEPLPSFGDAAALSGILDRDTNGSDGREEAAREELDRKLSSFGDVENWPVRVVSGSAPVRIVAAAEAIGASMIVMGLGRHTVVDRWLGSETALRVMQLSHVPVLAVPENGGKRPRKIIVAVDFSDFSRRALIAALDLASPTAEVHLVNVIWISPGENPNFETEDWHANMREAMRVQFQKWVDDLGVLGGYTVNLHQPAGRAASEVAAVAERVGADLVVAGSHGHGFVGRTLFGGTSMGIMRRVASSVLIVPPSELSPEIRGVSAD